MDATTLFASEVRSLVLRPSGPVEESEHENMPINAKAVTAPLASMRFTSTPMNRTAGFRWVVTPTRSLQAR